MDIRVLGPFGVFQDDGERLEINSARMPGLYVATLAMTEDLRASHTYIAQRLWPDGAPGNIDGRLRQYVSELRKTAPQLVPARNEKGHCKLAVSHEQIDYLRFLGLLHTAREQKGKTKIETLRHALDEWWGEPLDDIMGAGFEADRTRLLGKWLTAWIAYLRALLETGRTEETLQEIPDPLARWPEDEQLFKIKLGALQIIDGPSGVKDAMDEWREGGRKPSHDLSLHYRALRESGGHSHRPRRMAVPQQLSAHRPNLVGRAEQYTALDRLLLGSPSSQARLVLLSGMPGIGKSTTALSWATKEKASFRDGILYADLNGYAATEPVPPEQVLPQFLEELNVEPASPTRDGMISAYRSAMAERNMLVVLDNARDARQVRPLLPGPGACAALITSRDRLDSLAVREGMQTISLNQLTRDDAARLLAETGGFDLSSNPELASDIAEFCGDLPLALVIVGAHLKNRVIGDLWQTRSALRDNAVVLDNLCLTGDDDLNVLAAFTASHRMLSGDAQRLFWHLAVHPGPTISRKALNVLEGGTGDEFRLPALEELRAASLLEEPVTDRYAFHDLIRRFAERLAAAEPDDNRGLVNIKVFDFLMHNAWSCDKVLVPGRVLPIGEQTGFVLLAPSSVTEAMEWFTSEYSTLMQAVEQAEKRGMNHYTWLLAMTLVTYQWRTSKYYDAVITLKSAAAAAEKVGTPAEQAMVYRMLGGTYRGLGNYKMAKAYVIRAVHLSEEEKDPRGTALSRNALAILNRESGDLGEAANLFRETLKQFRELGDPLGEAGALNGLGCIHLSLGEHEKALTDCDAAVRLFATTTDINGHANALVNRGRTRLARGEYDLASSDLSTALSSYRKLSYPRNEAHALLEFADSLVAMNRTDEAREMLLRAQSLFSDLRESTDEIAERIRRLG
jgi:tetratricopeptide (TPR) repeat protein/DNA-binding SARP family transcriptional activator